MNKQIENEDDQVTQVNDEQKPFLDVLVHSFFVIPFLIAVFCILLFVSMHLLTRENQSVFDYLEDIKTGGATKRWQGAFELSKFLANPAMVPQDARFVSELSSIYEQSKNDDPRVRQYLALAMGRSGKKVFFDTLVDHIEQEKKENLPAVIYALGMLQESKALPILYEYLNDEDARIRSLAVVALGNINDKRALEQLMNKLNDAEVNVRWGAAISLANMGNQTGENVLLDLLNRDYYKDLPQIDVYEQSSLMLKTIEAAGKIKSDRLNEKIRWISQNDQNMKIKSAALKFIQNK